MSTADITFPTLLQDFFQKPSDLALTSYVLYTVL